MDLKRIDSEIRSLDMPWALRRAIKNGDWPKQLDFYVYVALASPELIDGAFFQLRKSFEFARDSLLRNVEPGTQPGDAYLRPSLNLVPMLCASTFGSAEEMKDKSSNLSVYAGDPRGRWLLGIDSSSRIDEPIDLPMLDVNKAILIAESSDSLRYALDYRGNRPEPRVVLSSVVASEEQLDNEGRLPTRWIEACSTVGELLETVKLLKKKLSLGSRS